MTNKQDGDQKRYCSTWEMCNHPKFESYQDYNRLSCPKCQMVYNAIVCKNSGKLVEVTNDYKG